MAAAISQNDWDDMQLARAKEDYDRLQNIAAHFDMTGGEISRSNMGASVATAFVKAARAMENMKNRLGPDLPEYDLAEAQQNYGRLQRIRDHYDRIADRVSYESYKGELAGAFGDAVVLMADLEDRYGADIAAQPSVADNEPETFVGFISRALRT